jgi:lysophospholipase L1-like esterase
MIRSYMPADVIIVMLGSNDLLNGSTVSEATEKMSAFLAACEEAAPDSALLLVAPPPMQIGEWVQTKELIEKSRALGKTYRALAERKGVLFADSGRWKIPLTYDGVHFTEEGHRRFASGIAAALP